MFFRENPPKASEWGERCVYRNEDGEMCGIRHSREPDWQAGHPFQPPTARTENESAKFLRKFAPLVNSLTNEDRLLAAANELDCLTAMLAEVERARVEERAAMRKDEQLRFRENQRISDGLIEHRQRADAAEAKLSEAEAEVARLRHYIDEEIATRHIMQRARLK